MLNGKKNNNKKTGRAEGRRPGLGIRFGERSQRYFSGQGRIQTMWLKEASQSIITVLINHRANVVGEIDACIVIKAQTSQRHTGCYYIFFIAPSAPKSCSINLEMCRICCIIHKKKTQNKTMRHKMNHTTLEYVYMRQRRGGGT